MRHGITRRLTREYNPIPGKNRLIKALNWVNISVHIITFLCVKYLQTPQNALTLFFAMKRLNSSHPHGGPSQLVVLRSSTNHMSGMTLPLVMSQVDRFRLINVSPGAK